MTTSEMAKPLGEHVVFWRKLAHEVGRGVPLLQAIDKARSAVEGTELERAALAVANAVNAGEDFSKALEAHSNVFSRGVRTMVRAGEAGGVLDVIAKRIAEGLEDGSFPLPGAEGGMEPGDAVTARSFRAFGRLLSSGVPALTVTEILAEEAPTPGIAEVWRSARKSIMEGVNLSDALLQFPELMAETVVDAVRWGERTGRLDEAAKRIADALDKDDIDSLPGAPAKGSVTDQEEELVKLEDAAPIIKLVNMIILEGVKSGATDIHIEPYAKEVKVRYRIDGVCIEKLAPPKKMHNAVVSRIKIMAQMDVAERRRPQDGKIRMTMSGKTIDFRVAVMPAVHGEMVVMRILRRDAAMKSLEDVVSVASDLEKVRAASALAGGLVLVTGLPGSGKSTLLYSMVAEIDRKARSVVSIEDPVEYLMDDVQQVNMNHKAGLTFATAMRSVFRLDADMMVIGDIRDTETAEMALKAAMTGHLVMAAMHTPTPVDTVTRFIDMGLQAYELKAALAMVVSQRLVRKLCPECRMEVKLSDDLAPPEAVEYLRGLKDVTLFSPVGCDECNGSGYKGRAAIQEILVPDDGFRKALTSGADRAALHDAAREAGMKTFLTRGLDLAARGVTSVDEVLRVASKPR